MNQECSIVRDLLPLYAERLTSPETAAFVEKHLRTCADCRAALQETQAPPALQPAPDAAPLQHLQKRLARKRLQIIVMTALFVLTAVISAAGILNAPIYFPYTDDLVQVTEDAGALELTFRADVANVSTERFVDPDDPLREICLVEAWSTLWERWSPARIHRPPGSRRRAVSRSPFSIAKTTARRPFISRESRWPPAA